jgi:hypothetical protein
MAARSWLLSLTAIVALVFVTLRAVISPFSSVVAGEVSSDQPLRTGFARSESDGYRHFSWIVGNEATIILPRSSAAASVIVLTAQSLGERDHPPQRVTAILNGQLIAQTALPAGWQDIRFDAPRSAWWVGFNELKLVFSSTVSPRRSGAGSDSRELALALSRLDLTPHEK